MARFLGTRIPAFKIRRLPAVARERRESRRKPAQHSPFSAPIAMCCLSVKSVLLLASASPRVLMGYSCTGAHALSNCGHVLLARQRLRSCLFGLRCARRRRASAATRIPIAPEEQQQTRERGDWRERQSRPFAARSSRAARGKHDH